MDSVSFTSEAVQPWPPRSVVLGLTWQQARTLVLVAALALAAALRLTALSTYGFSDDEVSKIRAIDAYRRGDFTVNAEHPMLMKVAMWGSLSIADAWNRVVPSASIAPETALRLPNALVGVGTVAAVHGVARLLFGPAAGLLSAILVAADPNITALNRIGKEDTFLVFFFLVGVWLYERAKQVGVTDPAGAQRWYVASGASFGLMLASKYMPHFIGMYALANVVFQRRVGANAPRRLWHYGTMVLVFIAANFTVLMPSTWAYCISYVQGGELTHHGFLYGDRLYNTSVPVSPLGVPVTYYLYLFATKVPIAVLAAAAAGLIPLVRRRRERGYVWLRVMLVFLLIPYSMMAAKFQRYSLPMLVLLDMLAAVGVAALWHWLQQRPWSRPARHLVGATAAAVVLVSTVAASWSAAPFFSVHRNSVAARLEPQGSAFNEEAYDFGVREAVAAVVREAAPGAAIVSDVPQVVRYYLGRTGRSDIAVRALSGDGLARSGEQWVFVQDDHIYFENALTLEQLRRWYSPWREYRLRSDVVLQVFRLTL